MNEPIDPVTERAKQRIGTTLKDKWRLDELIGVGGMAAVYSATHRNGNRVAVKMLHAELSVEGEIRSRFLREGYVGNKVEHPGAVKVSDDDVTEDGAVFLVMELLQGETLAHRFERKARSLSIEEVLLISDQVLDVLTAAHEKQIVHRDIKPDNIFLTRDGGVKLLDFGIARLRELSQTNATRSGSTMGTPAYMAPEQARARWDEVDTRTDLWAVGATMFKLLTGRVVHVAETINEQLLAAMTQPAPPLATLVPTAPCPVVEIVDRALAFNRIDRWIDAPAMQRAVREAYQAVAGVAPSSVRLSFDDSVGEVARADTVAVSSKSATALSVARDSRAGSARPRSRRRSMIGWMVPIIALAGCAYYFFVAKPKLRALHETSASELAALPTATSVELAGEATLPPNAPALGAAAAQGSEEAALNAGNAPVTGEAAPPAIRGAVDTDGASQPPLAGAVAAPAPKATPASTARAAPAKKTVVRKPAAPAKKRTTTTTKRKH